jgi:hypothetical protein
MKRVLLVLTFAAAAMSGCKTKSSPSQDPAVADAAANLTDLSTSLDAVRTDFNARKQESRFLTLLSPA